MSGSAFVVTESCLFQNMRRVHPFPLPSTRHNSRVIRAVGTDLVDVTRLEGYMDRVPGLRERLFTSVELAVCQKRAASLGARLAAKEAVLKALGSAYAELGLDAPEGWAYQDIEVTSTPGTPPRLRLTGAAAMAARQAGIGHWHLSLAHDGGMAQAFVVAQADHVDNDDDLALSSQRSQARTKQQIRSLRPAL